MGSKVFGSPRSTIGKRGKGWDAHGIWAEVSWEASSSFPTAAMTLFGVFRRSGETPAGSTPSPFCVYARCGGSAQGEPHPKEELLKPEVPHGVDPKIPSDSSRLAAAMRTREHLPVLAEELRWLAYGFHHAE